MKVPVLDYMIWLSTVSEYNLIQILDLDYG